MASVPLPETSAYTYEDYKHFPDELRCEIIDGRVYDMTPAPSTRHQEVAGEIFRLIKNELSTGESPCRVFIAPTDVVLAENQVVQPDVLVVCDGSKIQSAGVFGAPDVVFEVLSPGTEVKDRGVKMELYERFGIPEYFLVHPDVEFVEKYSLVEGVYRRHRISHGGTILRIDAIGLELKARDLFAV